MTDKLRGTQEYETTEQRIAKINTAMTNLDSVSADLDTLEAMIVTVKAGTGSVASGATTAAITHSVGSAPNVVIVTGTHAELADAIVTTIGATTFTVTIPSAATADRTFYWLAKKN